jgi:hypothetical protein
LTPIGISPRVNALSVGAKLASQLVSSNRAQGLMRKQVDPLGILFAGTIASKAGLQAAAENAAESALKEVFGLSSEFSKLG